MSVEITDNTKEKILCEHCQKQCFVYVNGVKIYCDLYYEKYKKEKVYPIDGWGIDMEVR